MKSNLRISEVNKIRLNAAIDSIFARKDDTKCEKNKTTLQLLICHANMCRKRLLYNQPHANNCSYELLGSCTRPI